MKKAKTAELLGQRIRTLRKSKPLTQEELGAQCGVNYKYIGAIERGEENPALSILEKTAEGLGVEVGDLFRFYPEETDPAKLKRTLLSLITQIGKEESKKLKLLLKIARVLE